jgi:hypothetical protein
LHGGWKEYLKGISFEEMTTDNICIDDGIDQVLQTTLQEAFVRKRLMFARGRIRFCFATSQILRSLEAYRATIRD